MLIKSLDQMAHFSLSHYGRVFAGLIRHEVQNTKCLPIEDSCY